MSEANPPPADALARIARGYLALAERRRLPILALALAIAVAGGFGLSRLTILPRLEALLPAGAPSLVSIEHLHERLSGDSPLVLLVHADDPALARRMAGEMVAQVRTWEDVRWAMDRRELAPLIDRRFLYLDAESLADYADRIEEYVDFQSCAALPGCVNFDDEPPPLPSEAEVRARIAAQPSVRMLATYLGRDPDAMLSEGSGASDAEREPGEELGDLCSDDGTLCAVYASMAHPAGDLAYAESVNERAHALFASIRPPDAPDDLDFEVAGDFRNAPNIKRQTERDLSKATSLSLVLVLLIVALQFRGARALLLMLIPLLVAMIGVFGLFGALGVELNIISAFTLAILAGVGIDFGLHLLTHYGERRRRGDAPREANTAALAQLLRSILVAGATTGAAFAALGTASFRGFSQMGWMAALGVLGALLAFLLLFAPLSLSLHRLAPEKGQLLRTWPWLDRVAAPSRKLAALIVGVGVFAGVALGLVASGVLGGEGLSFEYEFWRLRPSGVSTRHDAGSAVQGGRGTVVYLLAEEPEELARTMAGLRGEGEGLALPDFPGERGDPLLLSGPDLIPADQDARMAQVARIRESIEDVLPRTRGDERARLEALLDGLDFAPLTPDSLPPWVADLLVESDGSFGTLGLVWVPLRAADARSMEYLSEQLVHWRRAYPGVVFASPPAILGEVVPGLRRDAPQIVGLAILGLVIATLVFGRSVRRSVVVLSPIFLAVASSLGLMVLFGWKLNLYNLLVLPVTFGVGVDGAVYVVWTMSTAAPLAERWRELRITLRAIIGSTLTTIAAFGTLMISTNPGVVTLGELALVTIGLSLVTNVLWLPALLILLGRNAPVEPSPAPEAGG